MRAHVFCRASGVLCAIPNDVVVETMRPLPVEALGSPLDLALGVSIIRGTATLVLDAGQLVAGRPGRPQRYVTVRVGARVVALAVDEVVGVGPLSAETLATLPPLVADGSRAIDLLGTRDRELLVVLQAGRLVSEGAIAAALGGAPS